MFDKLTKTLLALLAVGIWALVFRSFIFSPVAEAQAGEISPVIKTRGLIVVDAEGHERIFLGTAPDPKEGRRKNELTGITINDQAGFERFGMGLYADGTMQLGLDAPPGKGDDRNRERIHLVADSEGRGDDSFS